jgi:hypothetical protein
MGRAIRLGLVIALLAVAGALVGACGDDEVDLEVSEGEPVELGELLYNVQITRFLNPGDPEDEAYLVGQAEADADQEYLGVFMTVENEGDSTLEVPEDMSIHDTRDNEYEPLETESEFALPLGTELPGGDELPAPDTPAASGPIAGGMVLFVVDRTVTENRPIELQVPSSSSDEVAEIELDI